MTKLVLVLSFIGLAISLTFGILDPSSPVMWLSSTTTAFTILRIMLMFMVFGLLATNPPRNAYMRTFVGIVSMTLILWSLGSVYKNQLPVADAFLLLSVGISAGITVLERDIKAEKSAAKIARKQEQIDRKLATA